MLERERTGPACHREEIGIAARGAINGDVFVTSAIGGVIAVVTIFVFFPIAKMLLAAFATDDG